MKNSTADQQSAESEGGPTHLDLPMRQVASDDEIKTNTQEGLFPNQDEAQAVLQPVMSSAASRYTSLHTPAIEKAAALDTDTGFFDQAVAETDDNENVEAEDDGEETPQGPPSPEESLAINTKTDRSNHTRGVLGSALNPARHRSRSAGQEALKRLRDAIPSWGSSSAFRPSLPTSFFHSKQQQQPQQRQLPTSPSNLPKPLPPPSTSTSDPNRLQPRPANLRRVTSDDSLIYHSLSRQSSLGDDDRFHDVRGMVNIRLMALKDSLPDVPNFKMPSLARLQATARKSQISLNGIFSSDSPSETTGPLSASRGAISNSQSEPLPPPPLPPPLDDKSKDESTTLDQVLEELTGDLVILGGYRGSILRSAEPPHQQLWAPVKLGLNLRKADLEIGLDDTDEDSMHQRIIPSGMLRNIGPIDISRKLFKKLKSSPNVQNGTLRIWDFGYDWRLSPHRLSAKLQDFLSKLPSNQPGTGSSSQGAIVVAHSLGGLITRHAVNQRPELFAGVLYAGTPQRCVNILGPLRNGDNVLFNDKLLSARVNFSIRTTFALLPDDGFCFVDKNTGEEYRVDFLDPANWVKWRFSPCIAPALPPYNRPATTNSTPLTAMFPNPFQRQRSDSNRGEKKQQQQQQQVDDRNGTNNNNTITATTTTPPGDGSSSSPPSASSSSNQDITATLDAEQKRNYHYLAQTLQRTRDFRAEMAHKPSLSESNAYPPLAVLYGKAIPTVYAASVSSREAIECSDAYDDLIFRSGDGVVLARAAMLPEGYEVVRGGRVSSERGHITLLGDMPALGKALKALVRGRKKGIGLGVQ